MADTKISALTAATTLNGNEVVPGVQSASNVKVLISQIAAYIKSLLSKVDVGLDQVDNTSDLAKPVSTATQTALNGKSDTGHTHAYSSLSGLPTLFSGAFSALSGKPTTIAGYGITDAFSGAYADLTGKPTLFDGTWSSLTGKPTFATVATTGAYADLSGKPTLGSAAAAATTDFAAASHTHPSTAISDSTVTGRSILTAASNAAVKSAIGAASSGANGDITSLTGLTTALSVAQGGTGATSVAAARRGLDRGAASLTYAASLTPDFTSTNNLYCVLTGNPTINNPTGITNGTDDGAIFEIELVQDATGSRVPVSWGSMYDFGTAGAPTLTTTANKSDVISMRYRNGKLRCVAAQGFTP
jgi:hypothetical protein